MLYGFAVCMTRLRYPNFKIYSIQQRDSHISWVCFDCMYLYVLWINLTKDFLMTGDHSLLYPSSLIEGANTGNPVEWTFVRLSTLLTWSIREVHHVHKWFGVIFPTGRMSVDQYSIGQSRKVILENLSTSTFIRDYIDICI